MTALRILSSRACFLIVWLVLTAAISMPALSDTSIGLNLEQALAQAHQRNPGLAQIKDRAQALATLPSQVGALPDPKISINALNLPVDSFDTRQEAMTQIQFGVSQTLPFPGKLQQAENAARFDATAAEADVVEARQWLDAQVQLTWWQLYFFERALSVLAANKTLLKQFVEIARTKYEVGEGLQQDVLLAQLELSNLLDRKISLTNLRQNEQAKFNTLLNYPPERRLSIPETKSQTLPDVPEKTALYQQAQSSRPLLASERARINAAEHRRERAELDLLPDVTVGAAYGIRDNTQTGARRADFLSLQLSFTVPIFAGTKQQKAIDQYRHAVAEQRHRLINLESQVQQEISQAYDDYHYARERFELFSTGIIPQARQTVASMLAGYQVNKVDFLNLARSQITLFEYELQYWQLFTNAHRALARLYAAAGRWSQDD